MHSAHRLNVALDHQRPGRVAAQSVLLILLVLGMTGCSAWSREPPDTWRANYVRDPFRVWNANKLALNELDYRIEESDEMQGTMRGVSNTGRKGPEIVLDISQVGHGSDQVSVYVKPSFSETGETVDADLLEAAAAEFMKHLNDLLNG